MRTTALANQKGGCGESTTAVNFAACLANEHVFIPKSKSLSSGILKIASP